MKQTVDTSGATFKDKSYIFDGDKLLSPVPLHQLGKTLREAAFKYESDGRHDRAAGIREAAAAFDQSFRINSNEI